MCWELLGLLCNLSVTFEDIKTRLCDYHRTYYEKRTGEKKDHRCPCHSESYRAQFCWVCGYCHSCGCDQVTTSTPRFHRCSCDVCLNRCCGLFGATESARAHARPRHIYASIKQGKQRCQPGTPSVTWARLGDTTAPPSVRSIPPTRLPASEVQAITRATSLNQASANQPPPLVLPTPAPPRLRAPVT